MNGKVTAISVLALFAGFIVMSDMETSQHAAAQAQEERLAKQKEQNDRRLAALEEFRTNRSRILSDVKAAIAKENYQLAISTASRYKLVDDPELDALLNTAEEKRQALQNKRRTQIILETLNGIPDDNHDENLRHYKELVLLNPDNEEYQAKKDEYAKKVQRQRDREKAAEDRRKKIVAQFSAWDGSHHNLERFIKRSMHDPDSYEHVETTYGDRGSHLVVKTVFRGKNAFGGTVRNAVTAEVSLDGQILSIVE